MDIGQWLNGICLGQYVALFREHEIDGEVLPDRPKPISRRSAGGRARLLD